MNKLSSDVSPLLDLSTRKLLRAASEPLKNKKERAFIIGGVYA